VLRPEINRLLAEVDNRLALEKQETQTMRRDQILKQEPIFSGNLPPADLPNPHEPVRSEEISGGHSGSWAAVQAPAYPLADVDEEQMVTSPLMHDNPIVISVNGKVAALSAQQAAIPPTPQKTSWLARLLRLPSDT